MKKIVLFGLFALLTSTLMLTSCDKIFKNMKYSVQVNNQLATKAPIAAGDNVELYVNTFAYIHETSPKWVIIVGNRENDFHNKWGKLIINDGWFSASETVWENKSDYTSGSYPAIMLSIAKMRVNGKEYTFPYDKRHEVIFGNTNRPEIVQPRYNNFQSIMMPSGASMLKTILTVEPNILGTPNASGYDAEGLSNDPYKYIKIQGIVTN